MATFHPLHSIHCILSCHDPAFYLVVSRVFLDIGIVACCEPDNQVSCGKQNLVSYAVCVRSMTVSLDVASQTSEPIDKLCMRADLGKPVYSTTTTCTQAVVMHATPPPYCLQPEEANDCFSTVPTCLLSRAWLSIPTSPCSDLVHERMVGESVAS